MLGVRILLEVDMAAAILPKDPEGSTVLFLGTSWQDRNGSEHSLPFQPLVLPLRAKEACDVLPEHPLVGKWAAPLFTFSSQGQCLVIRSVLVDSSRSKRQIGCQGGRIFCCTLLADDSITLELSV